MKKGVAGVSNPAIQSFPINIQTSCQGAAATNGGINGLSLSNGTNSSSISAGNNNIDSDRSKSDVKGQTSSVAGGYSFLILKDGDESEDSADSDQDGEVSVIY